MVTVEELILQNVEGLHLEQTLLRGFVEGIANALNVAVAWGVVVALVCVALMTYNLARSVWHDN